MQSYSDGSYDYKQMYTIQDRRGPLPECVANPNTIFYELFMNPALSKFRDIVNNTGLVGTLNNIQGNFTIFVPINDGIPDSYALDDSYAMRKLVLQHMLQSAVPPAFIKGSSGMLVDTRATGNQILIETRGEISMINGYSRIIGSKQVGNAFIYLIDKIIPLSSNPLSNIS